MNTVLLTDSYKFTHHKMYPEDTEHVFSYFEPRVGAKYEDVTFFGLQYFLNKLAKPITMQQVEEAKTLADQHLGPNIFNYDMWSHIVNNLGGNLPIEIRALPEGSTISVSQPLLTIVNTDPKCAALTNHLETWLSHLWYSCTVATISRHTKRDMLAYLELTSESLDPINFMLHDFGMRGVSSMESASIGGAAHLINFMGTDTVTAIPFLQEYYGATEMPAFSVPASEHSVMTCLGEDGEFDMVNRILDQYPTGIVSIVSDSYNILKAVEYYSTILKDKILARDGKFVIRPDSGDPVEIVLSCLQILEDHFDITVNNKGFKELPPKIGLIWGDGVSPEDISNILDNMRLSGWAASNIVFGMGGGLLQKLNRDTMRFAFKASAICRSGKWSNVQKNPHSDPTKASKAGVLKLTTDGYKAWDTTEPLEDFFTDNLLELVFRNGKVLKTYSLDDIRSATTAPRVL